MKINRKRSFFSNFPITHWIILINAIVYLFLIILYSINESNINFFVLNPIKISQGQNLWTLILHMFSHIYFWHLFVNMFALFSFGGLCEKIIGRKRFLWFYMISGIFAGMLSVLCSLFFGYGFGERIFGSPEALMLGASGAIFAVAGLLMMLIPRLRFSIIFLPFFSLPAYIILPAFLVLFWVISIVFNAGIGNVAHFGGFISGVIYGLYLRSKYKTKLALLQKYFR